MSLKVSSPAFDHGGPIPVRYTCRGDDVSPPLQWGGIPPDARSLVLIVDDPDAPDPSAPKMTWVHWLLYNIPADSSELPEAIPDDELPFGTLAGLNDFGRTGYGGPCPPVGQHRYFHKLYCLDCLLPDLKTPTKADLLAAMEGHVIDRSELIGLFPET